jgi:cobalt/nickel transport system permease protein
MRLAGPLFMAAIILLIQTFLYGSTPLYSISLGGLNMPVYREGLSKGLLIGGRVVAGTSLVLFLSLTTSLNRMLGALKYFRFPDEWLEVLAFTYRYIFVFIEEAQTIMDAQRLRLGYRGASIALRSWGTLVGSLFTRVYDQANATYAAMVLRGYNGTLYIKSPVSLNKFDLKATFLFILVFLLLLMMSLYGG